MHIRFYNFFWTLILALTLNGCGFHLGGYSAGKGQIIPFQTLNLKSHLPPYSNFNKALQETLNSFGINTQESSAPITLEILSENFRRTLTSLGNAGQTTTYLLSYTVRFQLIDTQQRVVLPPQHIVVTRNFSITSNQLGGDLNTQLNLQEEMQRDVIQQLIIRISSETQDRQFS